MRRTGIVAALLGLSLLGCAGAKTVQTGKVYAPLRGDCAVRFENLDHPTARRRYGEPLGRVTYSGPFVPSDLSFEGKVRRAVSPEVCAIGGSVVTFSGEVNDRPLGGGIQYAVWHDRRTYVKQRLLHSPSAQAKRAKQVASTQER